MIFVSQFSYAALFLCVKELFMTRKILITTLVTVSLLINAVADEGMWLPDSLDKLHASMLKKRGLEIPIDEIYSTTKPSLKDAIVQISIGGTGSFVSPEGLILTNHHVAFSAVTAASSPEHDYINNGFTAKTHNEEIPAANYTVRITQEYKDVTAEVMSAIKPEMSAEDRIKAISQKRQDIELASNQGREKDGIQTQVIEASSGYQYFLYTYLVLPDVRLVYAPPKSIGYFGGDPDNFEWPRHCGDFSFLRAYVSPEGKPAAFSKNNVPFKPKKFLAINAAGVKDGDFTMVMGYPGATYRTRESYSVEYRETRQLPENIESFRERIDTLNKMSESDPALKIKLADQIFSLSNALKSYEGTVKGLERMHVVEQKREEEAKLTKWINADPARKAQYGNVLPKIAASYDDLKAFDRKQSVITEILASGMLMQLLDYGYGRALDKEKATEQRSAQFGDSFAGRLISQYSSRWKQREISTEIESLTTSLDESANLPNNQKIQYIESLFNNQTGINRKSADAEFAKSNINSKQYQSFDTVSKLINAPLTEFRASNDPLLKLVMSLHDEVDQLNKRTQAFNTNVAALRPLYVKSMAEMNGGPYYPDANFTLRFSYGNIQGYIPRDAVIYGYQTSLKGVIEKNTGREPFNAPPRLTELYKQRDFGSYIDSTLNEVPVGFISTNDITGGNSGSAVMNGKGEIIGLAFDGNYEGLGGDYKYDISMNRTISVDIRYVLFLMDKFANVDFLFKEMLIKK